MARKYKIGLNYFSHDVDLIQDKKVKLIKAKHGLIGYAVYLRLLEEIYRETGYYIKIDEDFNILFSDDNNINIDAYTSILNDCINYNLFSNHHYTTFSVLTSKRIQQNYFSGTERRKDVEFINEYLMLNPLEFYNTKKVNVNIITINVSINDKNSDKSTQSKVKESKVKESKEYSPEIKTFVSDYQNYVSETFKNLAPKITDSFLLKCCKTIDQLITIDKFTFDQVFNSLQWASNDSFWSDQIKSLANVRVKGKNGEKKFINMFTAYKKKDIKQSNKAEQRSQSNADACRRFINANK